MIQSRILLLFVLIFPLLIYSQKIDSIKIADVNKKARALDRSGDFQLAYQMINDLISKFENDIDSKYLAYSLQTKASIEKNLGFHKTSIETAKQALGISLKEKDTFNIAFDYNLIGIGYYFLSNYDSTMIFYEKSYDLKKKINADERVLAVSAYNLGIVYEDLAQPKKALELYLEAEKNLVNSGNENTFLSDIYSGIAHLYFYQKDINKASEYAEKAMDVGLKSYGEFNPNMTFVYTSYANILESKGKYKESIELLKKALKIRESTYGSNHEWTCESYYDLGNAFILDKQFSQAEKHYKKAIVIGETLQSSKNLYNAKSYLANFYVDQNKNLAEAEKLLINVLKYNISTYGDKNDLVSESYYYLAKIAKIKRFENEFWDYLSLARDAAGYSSEELGKIIAPFQALDALILEGEWYQKEYEIRGELEFLEHRYKHIDEEITLIKFIQKNFSSDRSRINLANEYREVFENGLNTCWALYHKSKKDSKYINKAFELSETNRNTSLLEGIQNEQFKKHANIPSDLLNLERQIKQKLARVKLDLYYEQTSSNPDKSILGEFLQQRILLSNRLDSLHTSFDLEFPKYSVLKYEAKIIKPSNIQFEMDNDSQLITYFLGENNLYTFNITKENITFLKGEVVEKVTKEIENLKMKLLSQKDIEESCKELYIYLLDQQIELSKSNLVIIPDNVLNYIPFEILANDENIPLMENFTISYSGSVHLYLELNNEYYTYDQPNYWLGFSSENNQNNKLTATNNEVKIISDLIDGSTFIGKESKKENFFIHNQGYSVLHFAMHAKIDNNNPLNNSLVFSDGDLTSSEIYVSDIKANLAVLSACNTGFGKLEKGEGIMSMARAFNYAGVPSVVMSLWKVPDKETKTIMVAFYKHLKKGKTKSEALREAKKDYLKSVNDNYLKHPYFWSGFIISGNTNALVPPVNNYYYYYGGILFLGLIITGMRIIKNKA